MLENKAVTSFTDLETWQQAHHLRVAILLEIKNFPREYIFGLSAQMQRSAISIGSNIAEGFSRNSVKEKLQFYRIAKGSLTELQDQLLVSRDINILSQTKFMELAGQSVRVHKLINGLIRGNRKFLQAKISQRESRIENRTPKSEIPSG